MTDRPEPQESIIYSSLEAAQEALDRGESVCIEMQPFTIDPALLRLGQRLQDKERLQQWHKQKNRIVARAPWGDTYTAEDAENGCIPSEAYSIDGEDEHE